MIDTEILTPDELADIVGRKHVATQRAWLDKNGWPYVVNAAGHPIVGRWAARLLLAGVRPTAPGAQATGRPNFAALD